MDLTSAAIEEQIMAWVTRREQMNIAGWTILCAEAQKRSLMRAAAQLPERRIKIVTAANLTIDEWVLRPRSSARRRTD